MKTRYKLKTITLMWAVLLPLWIVAQGSNHAEFLRDRLMVYYVEDPSTDQYRLLDPQLIQSQRPLFGNNSEMDVSQQLIRELFNPSSDTSFQDAVVEELREHQRPIALFLYFDLGPVDEEIATANWTNCLHQGHFTSCVTVEADDEYAFVVHYGANQVNSDGLQGAKNRLLTLMGQEVTSSNIDLATASQGGITIAFYSNYVGTGNSAFTRNSRNEFINSAESFAENHHAIGLNSGNLVVGQAAPVPVLTVQDIIDNASNILRRVRNELNQPNLKIRTIAIMTHGLTNYVNFGNANFIAINEDVARQKNNGNPPDAYETAEAFSNAIDPLLNNNGKVIFYACLSGSAVPDNVWDRTENERLASRRRAQIEQDLNSGGEGSVAKEVKDFLNANGTQREVWAHRTTAHAVGNPVWRLFKGASMSGESHQGLPFIQHHPIYSYKGNLFLMQEVKRELAQRNIRARNDRTLRVWIAREIPFVQETQWPLLTSAPTDYNNTRDYVFKEGLVNWFTNRWVSQNPDSL